MRLRKDGVETRNRILEAACQVFGEKGYRDSTVGAICKLARTNTASINYHFRDKETLYVEVWKHLLKEGLRLYPFDGGLADDASPEQKLRGHVTSILRRMSDEGQMGDLHRLYMKEMVQPTGLIEAVHHEIFGPVREHTLNTIRELLGSQATERQVNLCEISLISQCRAIHPGPHRKKGLPGLGPLTSELVDQLVDHITQFSLAGIRDLRRRIEEGNR